jgi:hypothetical protein
MPKEEPKKPAANPAKDVAAMAAPFPQSQKPQPGTPEGGDVEAHAVGEAADLKGSAGGAAGPAALGNQDDASARALAAKENPDAQPQPPAPVVPDQVVAIVPLAAQPVKLDANGIPENFTNEVQDKRHFVYKRGGAKFWRTDRPGFPKPVLMRNATHTWEGTEEEFKDQFERD